MCGRFCYPVYDSKLHGGKVKCRGVRACYKLMRDFRSVVSGGFPHSCGRAFPDVQKAQCFRFSSLLSVGVELPNHQLSICKGGPSRYRLSRHPPTKSERGRNSQTPKLWVQSCMHFFTYTAMERDRSTCAER